MGSPSLFVISGSNDFLRRRHLAQTVSKQRKCGWDVQTVDGSDTQGVMTAIHQPASAFGSSPVMVVVNNPEKVAIPVLEAHYQNESPAAVLVLNLEGDPKGNTKFGKFVGGLDKKSHMAFPLPDKKWEIPQLAAQFCVAEAKSAGKTLEDNVASAIVKTVGTDFGFLHFEVQKAAVYAATTGSDSIDVACLKATLSPIGEASLEVFKDALATRSHKAVAHAFERVRKSTKDPVMPVCGYIESVAMGSRVEKEGRTSFGWLHLAVMSERGMTPDQIADALGINQYRCKNFLMPEVSRWKSVDIIRLIKATASARRGVLNGQVDPWIVLLSRVMELCTNK